MDPSEIIKGKHVEITSTGSDEYMSQGVIDEVICGIDQRPLAGLIALPSGKRVLVHASGLRRLKDAIPCN